MLITDDKIQKKKAEISEKELRSLLKALAEHQKTQDANLERAMQQIQNTIESLKVVSAKIATAADQKETQSQITDLMDKITTSMGDLNMARVKDIQVFATAIDNLTNRVSNENIVESIEELKNAIVNKEKMEWQFDIKRDQITGAMMSVNAKQIK